MWYGLFFTWWNIILGLLSSTVHRAVYYACTKAFLIGRVEAWQGVCHECLQWIAVSLPWNSQKTWSKDSMSLPSGLNKWLTGMETLERELIVNFLWNTYIQEEISEGK